MKKLDSNKTANLSGGCQRFMRRHARERRRFNPDLDRLEALLDAYEDCIDKKFSIN